MVADVIKSFDTVDRSILDCALGRLGSPGWFRRVYFACIVRSDLGLNLLLVWESLGVGMLAFSRGVLLAWSSLLLCMSCRRLEAMPGIKPQLHADNLKCSADCPGTLFGCCWVHCLVCQVCGSRCVSWEVCPPYHLQGC